MTDIDLVAVGADVDWPDVGAAAAARPAATAAGGRIAELVEWLAGTQGQVPTPPKRVRCTVLGPVGTVVQSVADDLDAHVGELRLADGMDATDAFALGLATADDEVDSGTDLLVVAAPADTPAAALVVSLITGAEPVALLPRGAAAVDTDRWIEQASYLRDGRRRLADLRNDPSGLLTRLGDPRLAAAVALVIRAVARRTPVVLDGAAAVAAALICHDVQTRAGRWWRVADSSPDPVHRRAVGDLGQQPLLELGLRGGDGVAGLLTVPLLRTAAAFAQPAGTA